MFKKSAAFIFALALILSCLASCEKKSASSVEYMILSDSLADETYGIGFRKADVALGEEVQKQLVEMKKNGKLAEIAKKWFGSDTTIIEDSFTSVNPTDSSLTDIKAAGKLVMGLDDSFPPMGFRNGNHEIIGFDVDLAKEVCKRIGIELVLQPIDWKVKDKELDAKTVDCLWNGFTITDERKAAMYISMPYLHNRQVIVTLKSNKITTLSDLKGKTLDLQSASSAVEALDSRPDVKNNLKNGVPVEVKDNDLALKDLEAGGCDAVLMDEVVARYKISMLNK